MGNWLCQNQNRHVYHKFSLVFFLQNPIKSSDLRVEEMEEFVHISVEEDLKSLKQVSQTAYVGSQAPKKLSDSLLAKRGMSLISAGKKKLLGGTLFFSQL